MSDHGSSSSLAFFQDDDSPANEGQIRLKAQLIAFSDEWYRDFAEDPYYPFAE